MKENGEFSCESNKVIQLQIVRNTSDLTTKSPPLRFHPEFTHQLFGQSEQIFGYKWVKILISFSSASLNTLLEIEYGPKVDSPNCKPDDVEGCLSNMLKGGYTKNRKQFIDDLLEEKGKRPPGDIVYSSLIEMEGSPAEVEIFHSDRNIPSASAWMANMQVLSPLLIETALPIDFHEDSRWNLFSLYERNEDYHFLGFATVYNFYSHPDSIRPRISQFIILPPFQRRGLATKLLQGIYVYYRSLPSIMDIMVEDSTIEFQRIRDVVDCRDATRLSCYNSGNFSAKSQTQFLREVRSKLKLSLNQSYRVFEVLIWKIRRELNPSQQEEVEMIIKRRILWNIMSDHTAKREMRAALRENGLVATMKDYLGQDAYRMVDDLFSNLIDDYKHILIRVTGR